MGTGRAPAAEREPRDDRQQGAEEELPVQDVEIRAQELLGLLEQERLAEERDQMGEQPPAVGVERDADHREQQRERVMPRAVAPLRLPAAEQPLEHVAHQVQADQHQPVGEPAVQVGPEAEEREVPPERAPVRPLDQLQQQHHEQQGDQMRPGHPVGGAQQRRGHGGEIGQQRLHPAAQEEAHHQRVGQGEQQAGQHGDAREATEPIGPGVQHLAAPFEGDERRAGAGIGEIVDREQPAVAQHPLAEAQVSRQITVGAEEPTRQRDRDDRYPQHEDEVEQGRLDPSAAGHRWRDPREDANRLSVMIGLAVTGNLRANAAAGVRAVRPIYSRSPPSLTFPHPESPSADGASRIRGHARAGDGALVVPRAPGTARAPAGATPAPPDTRRRGCWTSAAGRAATRSATPRWGRW